MDRTSRDSTDSANQHCPTTLTFRPRLSIRPALRGHSRGFHRKEWPGSAAASTCCRASSRTSRVGRSRWSPRSSERSSRMPDADVARRQLREVATRRERSLPKAAAVLADTEDDVTADAAFPRHHWRKVWSTNPLERVGKEIRRRTNFVGVFPGEDAVLRLVGTVLAEQQDAWQTPDRRFPTMNRATVLDLAPHARTRGRLMKTDVKDTTQMHHSTVSKRQQGLSRFGHMKSQRN